MSLKLAIPPGYECAVAEHHPRYGGESLARTQASWQVTVRVSNRASGSAAQGIDRCGGSRPEVKGEHRMSRREADTFMGPIGNHGLFFCGFHVAKNNPEFQVTTMHYCGMRAEGEL